MSTRANIELYDGVHRGVMLYHHCDGYPSWMGPELERKLKQAQAGLDEAGYPYWWDSERVGALIVKLSANESDLHKNVPTFQPCLNQHGDIEYLWRVYLGPGNGEYEIQCFRVSWDWEKGAIKRLDKVDWKEEGEL